MNGGFTGSRAQQRVYPASPDPASPPCCGSQALLPGANLTSTGNFTRQAAGGGFQVTNEVEPGRDIVPPGQVTDLSLVSVTAGMAVLHFTAPGDDVDSEEAAAEYIVKFSSTGGNLTGGNFDSDEFNTRITQVNTALEISQ